MSNEENEVTDVENTTAPTEDGAALAPSEMGGEAGPAVETESEESEETVG